MTRNVVALTYLKNFTGQRDGTGRPGKRQKLVPGQTFGKEREIAVTIRDRCFFKVMWQKEGGFCSSVQDGSSRRG